MPGHPAESYRPLVLQRCGGCGEQSRPSAPELALSRQLRLSIMEADAVILILLYDRGCKKNASHDLAQFCQSPLHVPTPRWLIYSIGWLFTKVGLYRHMDAFLLSASDVRKQWNGDPHRPFCVQYLVGCNAGLATLKREERLFDSQKYPAGTCSRMQQAHQVMYSTAEICDSSIHVATTCPRFQFPKGPAAASNL